MKSEGAVPKVSVLMAVYNAERYLAAALESILGQTFTDFEFIVVDDGSNDESARILAKYGAADRRLRIIPNEANSGLAYSLNKGIDFARGAYIARMDADDISLPTRLAAQVAFLDAHPDCCLCGGALMTFSTEGAGVLWQPPLAHDDILSSMIFESVIYHPTVMMRGETLNRYGLRYAENFRVAQDYELWIRLAEVGKLANLPEVLLHYRLHVGSASSHHGQEQIKAANHVRRRLLADLGIEAADDEAKLHQDLAHWRVEDNLATLDNIHLWLSRLRRANELFRRFPDQAFNQVLSRRWYFFCEALAHHGLSSYRYWRRSDFATYFRPSFHNRVLFLLRALFRRRQ